MDRISRSRPAILRDVARSPWTWAFVSCSAVCISGLVGKTILPLPTPAIALLGGMGLAVTSRQFIAKRWTRIHHEATKIRMKLLVGFHPCLSWYNRIWVDDEQFIYIGAMPLEEKGHLQMFKKLKLSVLRCVQDFELEQGWFDTPISNKRLEQSGIKYLHLKSTDHQPVTAKETLEQGTQFIQKCVSDKKAIYVHCRAGRGRSVTLVIAWLMRYKGHSFERAYHLIKHQRPHICLAPDQQERIEAVLNQLK